MPLCRIMGIDLNTPIKVDDSIHNENQSVENLMNHSTTDRIGYCLLEDNVQMARQNIKLVSDNNYRVGMESIVNLLEAKAQWQKAYSDLIDALTDFKVQESNFLRISNQLMP